MSKKYLQKYTQYLKNISTLYFILPLFFSTQILAQEKTDKNLEKDQKQTLAEPKNEKEQEMPTEPATANTDTVEKQYWRPHEKDFDVVQNKQFRRTGRFEISPLFGIYQRVDVQASTSVGGSVAYHFTDLWSVEAMGYKILNTDSSLLKKFKSTRNATIEFNPEESYMGLSGQFAPIYGKFSFMGLKISHFDIYATAGAGLTKTLTNRFTPHAGLGQKFWLSNHWNLRIEYRWMRYTDTIPTNEGITAKRNGGPGFYEDTINTFNLLFGISFLFH